MAAILPSLSVHHKLKDFQYLASGLFSLESASYFF